MRILFLRPRIEMGGASRILLSLSQALEERGHTVIMGASGGEWFEHFPRRSIVPLYPSTPIHLIQSTIKLVQIVRQQRIEIIHTHHRFAAIVGRVVSALTRVPLVSFTHEFKDNWRWLAPLWNGDWICVSTELLRRHLIDHYHLPPERIVMISSGIPPLEPAPSSLDYLRSDPSIRLIGCVGRLSPEKGIDTLLHAMPRVLAQYPSTRAVIIGEGSERKPLEDLAHSLHIQHAVTFLGYRLDAPQLISACDVIVMPSLTENNSQTAIEAMMLRRPIVASNVGALPEMVEDGVTGFLVPPREAETLAQKIVTLLQDSKWAEAMGEAGQRKTQSWTPQRAAAQLAELYQRAIAEVVR